MQITDNMVVALDYKLSDAAGELLDESVADDPLYYLHGFGNIVPGLEEELAGKSVGDKLEVTVDPENGFGMKDPELVRSIPIDMFDDPAQLEPGLQFDLEDNNDVFLFTIVEVKDDEVVADGNHELAGMRLTFNVAIREIREATAEEIEHGHAHGPNMEPH